MSRRVSARKVRGSEPASYYAVVLEGGRPTWSCQHDHPDRQLARRCARRWLRLLRSDAPAPAGGGKQAQRPRRPLRRPETQPLQGRKPVLRRSFLEGLLGCAVYEPDTGEGAAFGQAVHDAIHLYWQACLAAKSETRLAEVDRIVAQVMATPRGLNYERREEVGALLDQFARTHLLDLDRLLWTERQPWLEREFVQDVGWAVITGQPDRVDRVDGGDLYDPVQAVLCHDYKTSWARSDYLFQGRSYAQLAFLTFPHLQEFGWMPDLLYRSGEPRPIVYARGELDEWWEDMLETAREIWALRRSGRANPTGGAPCQYCDLRYVCAGATMEARNLPENDDQAIEIAGEWARLKQATKERRGVLLTYTARTQRALRVNGEEIGWMTPREAAWKATDALGIIEHATAVGYDDAKNWLVTWVDGKKIPNLLKPQLVAAGVARYEMSEPSFKSRKLSRAEQVGPVLEKEAALVGAGPEEEATDDAD